MISVLQIQLLIALIAFNLMAVKSAGIKYDGIACSDMASALPKLQTLTGTPSSSCSCSPNRLISSNLAFDQWSLHQLNHVGTNASLLLSGLSRGRTVWSTIPTTWSESETRTPATLPAWCSFEGVTCGNVTGQSNYARVVKIALSSMMLAGTLPPFIGNFGSLTKLDLGFNLISGTIPYGIGYLTSLQYLNMESNFVAGSIPRTIGSVTSLRYFNMQLNRLTGSIPENFGDLTDLEYVSLHTNLLAGRILPEFFLMASMMVITVIDFHSNSLTGTIPAEVGSLNTLKELYLHSNKLTGKIPSNFDNLMAFRIMSLHSNNLTGTIPDSIFDMALSMPLPIAVMDLHSNSLTGTISANIGLLTKLTKVSLHSNFIRGTIPSQFSNLTALSTLDLHMNYLTMGSASTVPTTTFSSATLFGNLDLSSNCLAFTSMSKPAQSTTPTRCAPTRK